MKKLTLVMAAVAVIVSLPGLAVAAGDGGQEAVNNDEAVNKEQSTTTAGTWDKTRESSKELWQAARKTGGHAWEATKETGKEVGQEGKVGSQEAWQVTQASSKEVYHNTREKTVATSKDVAATTTKASKTLWQSVTGFFSNDDSKK